MPEIAHVWDWSDTEVSVTETTLTTKRTIAASSFVGGGKYLFIWKARLGSTDTAGLSEGVLSWATQGDIAQTNVVIEDTTDAGTSSRGGQWSGYLVVDVPATAEDLHVKLRKIDVGTTWFGFWRLIAIRLDEDLVENTDFYVDTDDDSASPVAFTTTAADFATSTHTFVAGKWLFLGMMRLDIGTITESAEIKTANSGGGVTTETATFQWDTEGEDLAEFKTFPITARVFDLDGTSFTYKLTGNDTVTAGNDHVYSQIIAINLDKFEQVESYYNSNTLAVTTNAWTELGGITPFTPATANSDWVLIGSAKQHTDVGTAMGALRMQVGDVSVPSAYLERTESGGGFEVGDGFIHTEFSVESLAASSQNIDLDARTYVDSMESFNNYRRSLVAWSMKLLVTYEQEGFRFRNDDGSESGASWLAAQDTGITQAKAASTHIRVLTNVNDEPTAKTRTLQYKRSDEADTEWREV